MLTSALEALYTAMGKPLSECIKEGDMCAVPVFAFHPGLLEIQGSKQSLVTKPFMCACICLQHTFETLLGHISRQQPLPERDRKNFERLLRIFMTHFRGWSTSYIQIKRQKVQHDLAEMLQYLMSHPDGEREASVMECFRVAQTYRDGLQCVSLSAKEDQHVEAMFAEHFARIGKHLSRLLDSDELDAAQAVRAYHALLVLTSETPRFPVVDMAYVARVWRELKAVCAGHAQSSVEEDILCRILAGLAGRTLLELYCAWRRTTFPFAKWPPSAC